MRTVIMKITMGCAALGLLIHGIPSAAAQSQPVDHPSVFGLSSVKPIVDRAGTFKRSLTFSSGEVSLGMGSGQINRSDVVDSLQYLAPGNRQQGLMTLCPLGTKDNSVLPQCAVVGIARSFPVQKENMERWVAEITPQLIGQAQWDVSPKNNLHGLMLRNATAIEPAFDLCLERILQAKDVVQPCFQTSKKDEALLIVFRLCYGEMKSLENGIDLNSNISTPITFCAVDRRTGQVASLYIDEARDRIIVALSAPISLFELYSRTQAAQTQEVQKQYTPPKL